MPAENTQSELMKEESLKIPTKQQICLGFLCMSDSLFFVLVIFRACYFVIIGKSGCVCISDWIGVF